MIDLYGKADFPDEKIVFEREMMGEFGRIWGTFGDSRFDETTRKVQNYRYLDFRFETTEIMRCFLHRKWLTKSNLSGKSFNNFEKWF